jgi:hypothetical protein
MVEWDSELYLRYEEERTQPSLDLAWRIRIPIELSFRHNETASSFFPFEGSS